jgi:deoxyribose-phosphate aldolase
VDENRKSRDFGPVAHPETLAPAELAPFIDHTLLKPGAGRDAVRSLCEEALEWGFHAVCVNPVRVKEAADFLRGSGVTVCTVAGFPLGAAATAGKVAETRTALKDGAGEIDMVLHRGALLDGEEDRVVADVRAVVEAAEGRLVKVILETGDLDDARIIHACALCREGGAHFVKTSTGFGAGGATEPHVRLMRETVGNALGVKASGGIGDYRKAVRMLAAGASRLGASAGVSIVQGR